MKSFNQFKENILIKEGIIDSFKDVMHPLRKKFNDVRNQILAEYNKSTDKELYKELFDNYIYGLDYLSNYNSLFSIKDKIFTDLNYYPYNDKLSENLIKTLSEINSKILPDYNEVIKIKELNDKQFDEKLKTLKDIKQFGDSNKKEPGMYFFINKFSNTIDWTIMKNSKEYLDKGLEKLRDAEEVKNFENFKQNINKLESYKQTYIDTYNEIKQKYTEYAKWYYNIRNTISKKSYLLKLEEFVKKIDLDSQNDTYYFDFRDNSTYSALINFVKKTDEQLTKIQLDEPLKNIFIENRKKVTIPVNEALTKLGVSALYRGDIRFNFAVTNDNVEFQRILDQDLRHSSSSSAGRAIYTTVSSNGQKGSSAYYAMLRIWQKYDKLKRPKNYWEFAYYPVIYKVKLSDDFIFNNGGVHTNYSTQELNNYLSLGIDGCFSTSEQPGGGGIELPIFNVKKIIGFEMDPKSDELIDEYIQKNGNDGYKKLFDMLKPHKQEIMDRYKRNINLNL